MVETTHKGQLIPGVSRYSRSQRFSKRGLYLVKNKAAVARKETTQAAKSASAPAVVNDLEKALTRKPSKFYPADAAHKPKVSHKAVGKTKLRKSLKPGSILILLAGRFRGKRVVFLKQLKSGLLLVTGPYKINGVPLKRVNQAYVIATSTQVDISGIKITENINDEYFKREADTKLKGTEEEFFGKGAAKKETPSNKIADQKEVDSQIIKKITADHMLSSYLKSSFSLTKGQAPHLMRF
ncbi:hypothetical protein BB561_004223 [Smittium simulii]|uniref:Large ribosomal subunit protein uL6 N-terminal domain-containing protein n=1 Tax=Smittium simulii TaxID=133385 RepID=A0A2T9YHH1_9FUNG|nr:hypothetical protein BB561_004223 [Smittium simulii]